MKCQCTWSFHEALAFPAGTAAWQQVSRMPSLPAAGARGEAGERRLCKVSASQREGRGFIDFLLLLSAP